MEEKKYKILIEKYLNGELFPPEAEQLKDWLSESPAHVTIFNQLKESWNPFQAENSRVEKVLNETRRMVFNRLSIRSVLLLTMRYAAVVAISFFVYFVIDTTQQASNEESSVCSVYAPRGQKTTVTLPDGSTVYLNSDTEVKYNTDFHVKREVSLSGEAFFEVEKNPELEFRVLTDSYDVVVHGTSFNVSAYSDYGATETTLISGAVSLVHDDQIYKMKAGQRVVYKENRFIPEVAPVEQVVAWKNNEFVFSSIRFEDLIYKLEKWYNVDIEIEDENLRDIIYSGTFKNEETIWQVLDVLTITEGIRYEKQDLRKIIIKK